MCELFCLSSRVPTRATFSLQTFASHGAPGRAAIDGWGVAFHDGCDVRLYKEPEPAGDSAWLALVERRGVASPLILSHIRRAIRGAITLANTQPFVRELGGRMHVFAHNGRLDGIEARSGADQCFRPVGTTDSELAFCLLLDYLAPLWHAGSIPEIGDRLDRVTRFAADMREMGPANFLYADSEVVFAHGDRRTQTDGSVTPPGLGSLCRKCAVDADALTRAGVTIGGRGRRAGNRPVRQRAADQ
ncbi:class II glutamine amidotransferase [bacterium]|nr:MAG: class II glutamine amidotransferase [bacterium]